MMLFRGVLLALFILVAGCGDDQKDPVSSTDAVENYPDIVQYLANPVGDPPPIGYLDAAVEFIEILHERDEGATYSLRWGNLAGLDLYAVSVYPDLGIAFSGRGIDKNVLQMFIAGNLDLLSDPRAAVGTWFNDVDGNTYIDVSAVLQDKEQAIELGERYNQIAIWDLKNALSIATCDTTEVNHNCGQPIDNLPSPLERLPSW